MKTAKYPAWMRMAKLKATDAEGWAALGAWAKANGLTMESQGAFANALRADADHAGARTALGYEKLHGKWMRTADAKRKQAEKRELAAKRSQARKADRRQDFVPVADANAAAAKRRRAKEAAAADAAPASSAAAAKAEKKLRKKERRAKKAAAGELDMKKLKKKFKKRRLEAEAAGQSGVVSSTGGNITDYLDGASAKKRRTTD